MSSYDNAILVGTSTIRHLEIAFNEAKAVGGETGRRLHMKISVGIRCITKSFIDVNVEVKSQSHQTQTRELTIFVSFGGN